ncbi:hypothetical protein AB0465_29960 [Streptomyces griseoviridis]|uniref:Uncharacterized protein n=1 Tax=Streptomyces griseoviridis TaxID=45398 RepID=A0A3Q9KW66_STRGD|nr:hypothetical protein [Streptomyces griseoviridis]AZS85888.1 hypothetical protein ELQ87_17520 [Streptomyces griseoviridis]QCN87253.1 hypothetical protein DDJ31_21755 [Streptomyces griseoviridis]
MVFGKRKSQEQAPPVEAIRWEDVRRITIGRTERSVVHAKKPQLGRLAVRVPRQVKDVRTYAPCAYFRTDLATSAVVEPVLYEDEAAQQVLCAVDEPVEVGKEVHRIVRDGEGQAVGTLRRIPPANKLVHHTWRVDQPGRPEISGRSPWSLAHNTPKGLAMRGVETTLNLLLEMAAAGDPPANQGRVLEWHCGDELVMTSKGLPQHDSSVDISIKVGWLDRRLAFAVAMVPDFPEL